MAWAATRPRLAVWMLVLLTLGGCNDDSPSPALRVAVNPWPGYSFVYLAEEKGYFQEEGVSVRLIELASLADGRRVFEQGQADVMCCTLVEVLSTNESSGEDSAQIISAVDYSDGSDMLLACPDVKSLEAIRGCRIGVEPESVDGLSVFLALSSIGLTMEDVTLVALAQSEMIDAIRTGKVDAVQTYPPLSDEIERLEGTHRIWDSSQAPGAILDVLAAHQSLLNEREEELRAFVRAFSRAQKYFQEHRKEAVAILARRCGVSEKMLVRALDGVRLLADDDAETKRLSDPEATQALVAKVAKGLISIGMLQQVPKRAPFDLRFPEPSR
jgi:NitT/TauT family transport system substrate-binding protein